MGFVCKQMLVVRQLGDALTFLVNQSPYPVHNTGARYSYEVMPVHLVLATTVESQLTLVPLNRGFLGPLTGT